MRSNHTYKKENRFFYIWHLQTNVGKKYGWWKVCSWAVKCPSHSVGFIRLLVAQRRRIDDLEYRLHNAQYKIQVMEGRK